MWLITYSKRIKGWSDSLQESSSYNFISSIVSGHSPYQFQKHNENVKVLNHYKLTDEEVKDYIENEGE